MKLLGIILSFMICTTAMFGQTNNLDRQQFRAGKLQLKVIHNSNFEHLPASADPIQKLMFWLQADSLETLLKNAGVYALESVFVTKVPKKTYTFVVTFTNYELTQQLVQTLSRVNGVEEVRRIALSEIRLENIEIY